MKVLVVGSGGREHCLAWKLSQSSLVDKIFCVPGNGGTERIAENVVQDSYDIDSLAALAQKEKIDLVIVGPEAPLVQGLVDKLRSLGIKAFGPDKELALLEGSKIFAKEIMEKYGLPTAEFRAFTQVDQAKAYIKKQGLPLVIKADGLAAGKGVIIPEDEAEALAAVDMLMTEKKFGEAGKKIIIEQCLEGEEASILAITDGKTVLPLVSSQDHKRAFDNDQGPNTGGMGAYAPAPVVTDEVMKKVMDKVFMPLIRGLSREGRIYRGVLYAGLMIKNGEPKVLEFNVRFGDPETQVILPKLKTDLAEVMLHTVSGTLDQVSLTWDPRTFVSVVMASGGYPGPYEKGKKISGLEKAEADKDVFVFHAGTKKDKTKKDLLTSGGRVLNVVASGLTLKDARDNAYAAVKEIFFEGMRFRTDIGNKAL